MRLADKRREIAVAVILIILLFLYLISSNHVIPHQVSVTFDNSAPIRVTIVSSPADISRGLSFRERLPENEGMLFVFEPEGSYEIWMRDMSFPLDVIWLSKDLEVVHLEEDLPPCGQRYCRKYISPAPAKYILEVNAGYIEKNGVEVGNTMRVMGSL